MFRERRLGQRTGDEGGGAERTVLPGAGAGDDHHRRTVLSGTPCAKGTRIPACDIAEMLANGDGIDAIRDAWPVLTVE